MIRAWIIADDLTGANVTGALLTKHGYQYGTFLNIDNSDKEILKDLDVIALSSESRGISADLAYQRVYKLLEKSSPYANLILSKRIDSTLRGNIGSELDALLDYMGKESIILFSAAYPAVKKTVIGGYLLINGVPLEKTGVSRDPKFPVHDSKIEKIIQTQSRYPVGTIKWDTINLGIEAVKDKIKDLTHKGIRIISCDSLSDEDLNTIATATYQAGIKTGISDPGPLTLAYLKATSSEKNPINPKKIFLCIGSAAEISIRQIEKFKKHQKAYFENINTLSLLDQKSCEKEISRACQALNQAAETFAFLGITSVQKTDDILDLKSLSKEKKVSIETLSAHINQGMAEISRQFLASRDDLAGLYTSGGDITLAFMEKIDGYGMIVIDEIEPFTMCGKILGGPYHRKLIVTKGGLAGDEDSLIQAMTYLKEKTSQEGV